jgi:hypothetical protein
MTKLKFLRTIVKGLLRSKNVIKILVDIPCDIILDLENDANKAKTFVTDLENGKVPELIQGLPKEALQTLKDVVGIFGTLPSEIVEKAKGRITDAAKIFDDIGSGAIVSDIEKIPGVIVSDVTRGWGDLTSGLENDWNEATHGIACLFSDCPVPTSDVHSCGNSPKTPSAHPSPETSSAYQPPAQIMTPSSQSPVPSSTPAPPYPSWTQPAGPSNGISDGQYSTAQGVSFSMTASRDFAGSSGASPGNAQATSPSNYSNASSAIMRNNISTNRLFLSFIAGSLVFGCFLLL